MSKLKLPACFRFLCSCPLCACLALPCEVLTGDNLLGMKNHGV
uniref:Uncharacterized protein n=1 Tax=Rhizophora mucronata TaxID=61149 RepID=A0A2P2PP53_RHIMU